MVRWLLLETIRAARVWMPGEQQKRPAQIVNGPPAAVAKRLGTAIRFRHSSARPNNA